MENKKITRRKLLKDSALAAAAGALYMNMPFTVFAGEGDKTPVVLIRDQAVLDAEGRVNPVVIQEMLDRAVLRLTGQSDLRKAWAGLIKPTDVVGIKSNVWGRLPTPPELEQAIKKRVMEAGVSDDRISIRDRGLLSDPVFMRSTALINTRPLRTHAWSGVGSLIKNYITFTNRPSDLHPDTCADLATLWEYPEVKGKTRLNILVMLAPLFHGVGPHHFSREYTWEYKGLIAGFDPVACDSVGVRILQNKRNEYFGEERPISPPVKHIFLADTRHHLGTADPARINLIKMGWEENLLL